MASSIVRYTSTTSLISTASQLPRESNVFVQALNKHRDVLETACDKILEKCYSSVKPGARGASASSRQASQDSTASVPSSSPTTLSSQRPRVLEEKAREVLVQHLIDQLSSLVVCPPEPPPQSILEVDARLVDGSRLLWFTGNLMPSPNELELYRGLAEKGKKSAASALGGITLPVDKIFSAIKEFAGRSNYTACVYIVIVTEKVMKNFLKLAITYEESVQTEHVIRAVTIQNLLHIYRDYVKSLRKQPDTLAMDNFPKDYNKCVDEIVAFLSSSLEQMNLILRVFREPILHAISPCPSFHFTPLSVLHSTKSTSPEEAVVREIFSDALDLYNNFRLLLDYLESDFVVEDSTGSSSSTTVTTSSSPTTLNPSNSNTSTKKSVEVLSVSESRRLVGRLFEPMEDIALAGYSSAPERFTSVWKLSQRGDVLEALGRLSRAIVHTVSRLKATTADSVDPRLACLHSLCCPACRSWDHHCTQKELAPGYPSPSTSPVAVTPPASTYTHQPMPSSHCNSVVNCFRYLLPRLLLLPIFQFLQFYRLVNALHQRAYEPSDREFLFHAVDVLMPVRIDLERRLARHPALFVQLARLVSTGHLSVPSPTISSVPSPPLNLPATSPATQFSVIPTTARHRSYSASPAPPPFIANSLQSSRSSTPPPLHNNHHHHPNRRLSYAPHGSAAALVNRFYCADSGARLASPSGEGEESNEVAKKEDAPDVETILSAFMSGSDFNAPAAVTQAKLEELERIIGGKERLLLSSTLGRFIMEGQLLVREEGKREPSKRQAYLFTNYLFLCKRQERRSTLAPASVVGGGVGGGGGGGGGGGIGVVGSVVPPTVSVGGQSQIKVKRRLPLETFHVIDSLVPHKTSTRTVAGSSQKLPSLTEESERYSFSLEYFDSNQRQLSVTPECSAIVDGSATVATTSATSGTIPSSTLPVVPLNLEEQQQQQQPPQGVQFHYLHLEAPNPEEKADWMASLLSVATSRFAQPDTPDVIIFESICSAASGCSSINLQRQLHGGSSLSNAPLPPPGSPRFQTVSQSNDLDLEFPTGSAHVADDSVEEEEEDEDVDFFPPDVTEDSGASVAGSDFLPLPASTSSRILSPHLGFAAAPSLSYSSLSSSTILNQTSATSSSGFHVRPLIQFASLEKLIERLTYPAYFDAAGVNAFLLAYRRFITSEQLLDLLIERFNVPDPVFSPDEEAEEGVVDHLMRRFRSGYKRRVQARVVAFLSRWARNPRYFAYDFAGNRELRRRLAAFLSGVVVRSLFPVVQAIEQYLARAEDTSGASSVSVGTHNHPTPLRLPEQQQHLVTNATSLPPPPQLSPSPSYDLHLHQNARIDLLQIHPLELAEQVTLHEFDLYRRIQFWEVDGRKRSPQESPNLSAYKEFSNKFRNWLVHSILSEAHPDDRVLAIQRLIDLMLIFEHHRNLQGCQEAKAALFSAAVFRLKKAFQTVSRIRPYKKLVNRLRREGQGLARVASTTTTAKSGRVPLRVPRSSFLSGSSSTPTNDLDSAHSDTHNSLAASAFSPCVPYIAMGVITPLIHLELRHYDRLHGDPEGLINFAKQRRLLEIVEGFLCHQRVPYTFNVDRAIQRALANSLEEFNEVNEAEFEAKMYGLSEAYEPRETPAEQPPTSVEERRLSREAIQAASYLASLPLREKLLHEQVGAYKSLLLHSRSKFIGGGATTSSPRLASPPTPSTPPLPSSASADDRVVTLWATRLQQHRAGQHAAALAAAAAVSMGGGTTITRPLSSPTAASLSAVVHHHSASDSQMESFNANGCHMLSSSSVIGQRHLQQISSDNPLPLHDHHHHHKHIPTSPTHPTSTGSIRRRRRPPPPPPPLRRPSGAAASASASHSPSPLFPVSSSTDSCSGLADCTLPPLPPKPLLPQQNRVTSPVHNNTHHIHANSSANNQHQQQKLLFDGGEATGVVSQTPPLPPRRVCHSHNNH